jgi:DNA-binding NtrC family response regulator
VPSFTFHCSTRPPRFWVALHSGYDDLGIRYMSEPIVLFQKNIVLVVDDEQTIVRMATAALANAGFRAVVAENGLAGWDLYMSHREQICLVLVDVVMPIMSGVELAAAIRKEDPGAKILFMSGYSDTVLEQHARNNSPFIRKPFLQAELIQKIRSILDSESQMANV